MGLSSTGDVWCHKSDEAIQGLPNTAKIVDDIITAASSIEELKTTLREIFVNARQISERKFQIADSMTFAGYKVSADGVKPDPARLEAIKNFPVPTDVTGVRSFLGLAN